MIIPNTQRVLIKPLLIDKIATSGLVIAGQLKAGENLLFGQVVHGGDTKFKKGDFVYYSEYSAANVFNYKDVLDGKADLSAAQKEGSVVVAADDIMCFDDPTEVSSTTQEN